jgi:hypothetical protein
MPNDSAVARSYSSYALPRKTASAQQVSADMQKLHADYQSIIAAAGAAAAAPGVTDDTKQAATKLKDDAQRADDNLLSLEREQQLSATGPVYEQQLQQLQPQAESGGTGSTAGSEQETLTDAARLSNQASKDAAELAKDARKDSRQQLAAFSDSSKKVFGSNASSLATAAVLGSAAGTPQ